MHITTRTAWQTKRQNFDRHTHDVSVQIACKSTQPFSERTLFFKNKLFIFGDARSYDIFEIPGEKLFRFLVEDERLLFKVLKAGTVESGNA